MGLLHSALRGRGASAYLLYITGTHLSLNLGQGLYLTVYHLSCPNTDTVLYFNMTNMLLLTSCLPNNFSQGIIIYSGLLQSRAIITQPRYSLGTPGSSKYTKYMFYSRKFVYPWRHLVSAKELCRHGEKKKLKVPQHILFILFYHKVVQRVAKISEITLVYKIN